MKKDEMKISDLVEIKNSINILALKLGKNYPVFAEIYDISFNYTCSEAGFLKTISWLYILYFESAKESLRLIIEKFSLYRIDQENKYEKHLESIRYLRAYLQHGNISKNQKYSKNLVMSKAWFNNNCGEYYPSSRALWEKCLQTIFSEANCFLDSLLLCLQSIENDPFCKSIIEELNSNCLKVHSEEEFEDLVSLVACDIGMSKINPQKFVKKNYNSWCQELSNLANDADFSLEARKRIERDLLRRPILPITSSEIISHFELTPGPEVEEIMQIAFSMFQKKPCSKDVLLDKLTKYISIINT